MGSMFLNSLQKIKRAEHHLNELIDTISSYVNTDFCRVSFEDEQSTGQILVKFEMTKSIPLEIPLIIGDAVHNLRSALDHLACEMVSIAGETISRKTQFLFRDTRQELENSIAQGDLKNIGTDIISLLLDGIKPYKIGGNSVLYTINNLDIIDKHRLLIPTITIGALRHVNATIGGLTLFDCNFVVDPGGVVNIASMPRVAATTSYVSGQPVYTLLFDKSCEFVENKPVIPCLSQLIEATSIVVSDVEKTYLARK